MPAAYFGLFGNKCSKSGLLWWRVTLSTVRPNSELNWHWRPCYVHPRIAAGLTVT